LNRRIVLHCGFIALPTLALCALGAYFLYDKVPKLVRAQRAVVTRQYRGTAEDILRDPLQAASWGPRQKGWRQTGKIGRRGEAQVPWGHVAGEEGEIVWVGADPANVAQQTVPFADMSDVSRWLQFGVVSALAMLVAMTGAGIWFFIRYSRERDDFLAATAHDLTTPLVAMRRLIGRDDAYAQTLNERMLRLVANVTDFLRLGGRRRPPKCECFSVREAFDEAYGVFAADFAEETSGPVRVSGDARAEVSADRLMVVQILWNVLGNALKYAAPKGPVELTVVLGESSVGVSVSDVGPGMTKRQCRHAFDRYYRARTVLVSGKGGFGIGLCTAREFARSMGGDLTVAPRIPHGCIFTLTLPRAH